MSCVVEVLSVNLERLLRVTRLPYDEPSAGAIGSDSTRVGVFRVWGAREREIMKRVVVLRIVIVMMILRYSILLL